jgi:hypothetical protein
MGGEKLRAGGKSVSNGQGLRTVVMGIALLAIALTAAHLLPASPTTAATRAEQEPADFATPLPLPEGDILVIGFLGGRDRWNDETKGVRQLALKLRARQLEGVHVETVENSRRRVALDLVRRALDRNADGALDDGERAAARLIVYGQSFGGAAVVKLARELAALGVPVLLTVQIDSVGRGDGVIPPNVRRAANLFQDNGWLIRGEAPIRAEDPARTEILGNFRYDYDEREISLRGVPWYKSLARAAHAKMDRDPEVWAHVEKLLLEAIAAESEARAVAPGQ